MNRRRLGSYRTTGNASSTQNQAEFLAEAIRENLVKGWGSPARAYFGWGLSPELIDAVKEVLERRGIWRERVAA